MDPFDQLLALPDLRKYFDLAWRLFGVNPALVSPDGERSVIFEAGGRAQPFCGSLNTTEAGRNLCAMCDRSRFLEARRDGQALRYRCHAGLTEFVIPVIRQSEIIALIQCGQVHHRVPTDRDWDAARKSLIGAGIKPVGMGSLFKANRVLGIERQDDLLEFLDLIAGRIVGSSVLSAVSTGQTKVILGRAITYIETNLEETLTVRTVSANAGYSPRSLMRLFRSELGVSVITFIHRRRIAKAKTLLTNTGMTCAEIAFACGFGSVQQFNRVFRSLQETTPTSWRQSLIQRHVVGVGK